MSSHGGNSSGVSNENHLVGKILGLQVEMESTSVLIDGEFGSGEMSFSHSDKVLGMSVVDSYNFIVANATVHRCDVKPELLKFLFGLLYFRTKCRTVKAVGVVVFHACLL